MWRESSAVVFFLFVFFPLLKRLRYAPVFASDVAIWLRRTKLFRLGHRGRPPLSPPPPLLLHVDKGYSSWEGLGGGGCTVGRPYAKPISLGVRLHLFFGTVRCVFSCRRSTIFYLFGAAPCFKERSAVSLFLVKCPRRCRSCFFVGGG